MSAVGAHRQGSWQKPRRAIAKGNCAIGNRQAKPAVHGVMSAEIAAGYFSQIPRWVGRLEIFGGTPNATPPMLHENDSIAGDGTTQVSETEALDAYSQAVVGAVEH